LRAKEATLTGNCLNKLGGSVPTARTIHAGLRRACRLSEAGVAVSDPARSRPGIYETESGLFTNAAVQLAERVSNGTRLRLPWRQGPRQL